MGSASLKAAGDFAACRRAISRAVRGSLTLRRFCKRVIMPLQSESKLRCCCRPICRACDESGLWSMEPAGLVCGRCGWCGRLGFADCLFRFRLAVAEGRAAWGGAMHGDRGRSFVGNMVFLCGFGYPSESVSDGIVDAKNQDKAAKPQTVQIVRNRFAGVQRSRESFSLS